MLRTRANVKFPFRFFPIFCPLDCFFFDQKFFRSKNSRCCASCGRWGKSDAKNWVFLCGFLCLLLGWWPERFKPICFPGCESLEQECKCNLEGHHLQKLTLLCSWGSCLKLSGRLSYVLFAGCAMGDPWLWLWLVWAVSPVLRKVQTSQQASQIVDYM